MPSFNDFVEELKLVAGEATYQGFVDLLEGADEDLKNFSLDIAADLVTAQVLKLADQARGEALEAELMGQLALKAESYRIQANNEAWKLAEVNMRAIVRMALGIMSSG